MVLGGDPIAFFFGGLGSAPMRVRARSGRRLARPAGADGARQGHRAPVPANAEIVLEGFVPPDRTHAEGPFGEWTGHYGRRRARDPGATTIKGDLLPNDPIVLGVPPMGAGPDEMARYRAVMRSATSAERHERRVFRACSRSGATRSAAPACCNAVSIAQRYPGHAVQAAHIAAQCGASPMRRNISWWWTTTSTSPISIIFLWAMLTRTDPKESIQFITGSWDSSADPALPPERRAAGNMTHSVALINACKPVALARQVSAHQCAEPGVSRKAREKFGWLLD